MSFTTADRDALKKLWERLKWQLRIHSRNDLIEGALRRLDEKRTWVENVLEHGFTPPTPAPRHVSKEQLTPYVPVEGSPMGGFPDFATQSMEDLLHAEGLVGHGAQEYPEGFLQFEEFSGWEGFDVNM